MSRTEVVLAGPLGMQQLKALGRQLSMMGAIAVFIVGGFIRRDRSDLWLLCGCPPTVRLQVPREPPAADGLRLLGWVGYALPTLGTRYAHWGLFSEKRLLVIGSIVGLVEIIPWPA